MTSENINIGLIGAGGNTRLRHIPGFNAMNGVTVSAVCNRSLESGQRVADEFGIENVSKDTINKFKKTPFDEIV